EFWGYRGSGCLGAGIMGWSAWRFTKEIESTASTYGTDDSFQLVIWAVIHGQITKSFGEKTVIPATSSNCLSLVAILVIPYPLMAATMMESFVSRPAFTRSVCPPFKTPSS